MKYLSQFLIIIGFSLAGEILNRLLPLPIPASIYGIVLLFLFLELKWIKVHQIKEVSDFLLTIMPLLFLPPAVGLLAAWDNLKECWIQYTIITLISTFIVMGVAGLVTQAVIRHAKSSKSKVQSQKQ